MELLTEKVDDILDFEESRGNTAVNEGNGKEEEQVKEKEIDEDILVDDGTELTDLERAQLYEKAIKFKMTRSYKHALLCFLGCIKGIQHSSSFSMLPSCLQNISSIYAKFEDFPKAVLFMQAAKLYYETALIGSQASEEGDYKTMDEEAVETDARRANEYEKLSHDCLMQKKIQLALEYCGKATQLRRKVYGENHPVAVRSLDLFTMIYAEMGKMQYSDAVKKLDEPMEEKQETVVKKVRFQDEEKMDGAYADVGDDVDSSGEIDDSVKHSGEAEVDISKLDGITSKQLLIIVIISITTAVLITAIFCIYSEHEVCPSYNYISERVKFHYYYYLKSFFTEQKYI